MGKNNNKKMDEKPLLKKIEFWNLITLIIGGILGYFFIHRPLMTAQTKQQEVETKLGNLDFELKKLKVN